jgi:hypothetical protein
MSPAVPNFPEKASEPKASRVRVWQAADRILRSGRRPTVEGVRELLGGGSPNSVTAYINDWYRELGGRLAAAETPLAGFPTDAVSLLTELWRLASKDQPGTRTSVSEDDAASRLIVAERDALEAEAKSLQTLNQELQRHRAGAEKSLAEARALLARREAALDEERSRTAALEAALAQTRLELEVTLERQRLAPARLSTLARLAAHRRRRRKSPPGRPARKALAPSNKRSIGKKSAPRRAGKAPGARRKPFTRKR